ncbi:MAG TPA: glycosyltransferase [Planctomycetota bacterium]|nr:glycosyltransferase [Planctomycetota bacterium]
MDVLHVIHQFAPETRGGSESYVLDLARTQRARGTDVQVLTGSLEWRPLVTIDAMQTVAGVPVHRLHRDDFFFDHHVKAWHPGVSRAFDELLERLQPRLLHLHHWIRLSCDLVAIAHARGIPVVVTLHDFYSSCPRAFRMRPGDAACTRTVGGASCWDCVPKYGHESRAELEEGVELFAQGFRSELALARAVLVTVSSTADLLSRTTGIPRARYEVLPLGYTPRFAGQPQLPAPRRGEPFRFAFWGGAGRHKGLSVLLEAFRSVHAAHRDCELHLLGGAESPAFEQELRAQAAGLPVTLHGAFTPAQLRAVAPHCGVFPSTCIETYGQVLDECFELGLPCIVSDLGALPERAGAAGLKVRAGDAAALAQAMTSLAGDAALWQRLRAAAPPPSPDMAAHVHALDDVYARAQRGGPMHFAEPVPLARRLQFLQLQRDSALARLCPPGGPK